MSIFGGLFGGPKPGNLDELLDSCETLIEKGQHKKAISLAHAYGDAVFNQGDINEPCQFYELGASHLYALIAAHAECATLSGKQLQDSIRGIASQRRYIIDLLNRAKKDPRLLSKVQHYMDVAEATINDLTDRYGSSLDIAELIAVGELLYYENRGRVPGTQY